MLILSIWLVLKIISGFKLQISDQYILRKPNPRAKSPTPTQRKGFQKLSKAFKSPCRGIVRGKIDTCIKECTCIQLAKSMVRGDGAHLPHDLRLKFDCQMKNRRPHIYGSSEAV